MLMDVQTCETRFEELFIFPNNCNALIFFLFFNAFELLVSKNSHVSPFLGFLLTRRMKKQVAGGWLAGLGRFCRGWFGGCFGFALDNPLPVRGKARAGRASLARFFPRLAPVPRIFFEF